MPKLKQKLRNLLISRIDLVDSGDNPDAKIVLFKRNDVEKAEHNNLRVQIISLLIKAIERISQEKGILRIEAMKELFESEEGKKALEVLSTMKRREKIMYKSVGEIAEAIKKGELKSQEDAVKELDGLRDREFSKGGLGKSKEDVSYDQTTDLAWNSLFNEFQNLPETVEEGIAIEKRQHQSELIVKAINTLAEKLVQKEGISKEKAFGEVLKRHPLLEATYREFY